MSALLSVVLLLVSMFGSTALLTKVLYPCGDKLEHVQRKATGKPNKCGCPLSR